MRESAEDACLITSGFIVGAKEVVLWKTRGERLFNGKKSPNVSLARSSGI